MPKEGCTTIGLKLPIYCRHGIFLRRNNSHPYNQNSRPRLLGKLKGENVKKVKLLGHKGKLQWTQTDEALEIACPDDMPFNTSVVFKIEK